MLAILRMRFSAQVLFAIGMASFLLLAGLPAAKAQPSEISWTISTLDSVGDVGQYCSLEVSPQGSYNVAYLDTSNGHLKFASNATGAPSTITLDDSAQSGYFTSIDEDANGKLHIAYTTLAGDYLYYINNMNGAWVRQIAIMDYRSFATTSISDDGNDRVYITFHSSIFDDMYYVCNANPPDRWSYHDFYSNANVGEYSSLAMDPSSKTYTSFYDATNADLLFNSNFVSGSREFVDTEGDVGRYTSIGLDGAGTPRPFISYYDVSNGNLKLAYKPDPSTAIWNKLVIDSVGDVGKFSSICVEADATVHMAYYDATNQALKYAVWKDGVATCVTVDTDGNVGQYASIDVDARGRPFIAYYDASNGNLKLATMVDVPVVSVPGAPSDLSAIPGNSQVALGWQAPTDDGGALIDYYVIYKNGVDVAHPTGTSATISGLTNGVSYTFIVAAHNAMGIGANSLGVAATPRTVPGAPTGLTGAPGDGFVNLNWVAPADTGGALIDYYVIYKNGVDVAHPTGTSATISGLTNGVSYPFTVAAHNNAGIGSQSAAVLATPCTLPGAPTGLTATPGNASVYLSWTPPASDGGGAVDYYVLYCDGVDVAHPTIGSVTITGLTNGQNYSFMVAAHNVRGIGASSGVVWSTPFTVPNAPTALTATPGNAQVVLSWFAPTFNGGRAIDYYVIYQDGSALPDHPIGLTATITGLSNGQSYSFTVGAHNIAGNGPQSNAVPATPRTVPLAPTELLVIAGNAQATLTWHAPASDGGSPILGYRVYFGTTPAPGTLFSTVGGTTLTAVVTDLTPGVLYYFGVKAVNLAGDSVLSDVLSGTPYTVPGAPTLSSASATGPSVTLVWAAPSSTGFSPITGYKVFYGTSSTPTTQWDGLLGSSTFTVDVTSLTPGTVYYFAVKAVNLAGDGPASLVRSATAYDIPGAPIGLSAIPGAGSVTLSWSAPADNGAAISSYRIYRGTVSGEETFLNSVATTAHVDSDVTNGVTYYYKVSAVNLAGEGSLSSEASALPSTTTQNAPVLTNAAAGSSQVLITWTAPVIPLAPVTGYKVFYGTTSTPSMIFATVSSSTLSAEVTGLIPGTLYSFGIKAMNATGDSQLSNVRTAMPYTVADAPVLLAADEGSSQVALTWSAPSDTGFTPLTGYKILYGTVPEPSTPFATFGSDILAANATGLIPGTRYYFAVKAMNEAGDSSPSNIMSATPFTASEAPTLSSASAGSSKVTLTWTAPSMDGGRPVTAYRVYYGTTPAAGALFTTVDVATSSVDIMGLTPGTLYYFGIKAVNLAGDSPFSNIATATPYTSPGAPTLESAAEGPSQIMLIWSAPSYDGSTPIIGYKVFYGTTSPTVQFGDALPASVLSVNVTALTPGTTYHFAVKAINAAGDSHASNLRSAIPYTMPGAPTLESAASGPSQVTLMWTAPADLGLRPLLGYEIFYGTTAPDTQYQGLLPPEYGTINIMGLIPGTNYLFAVRALNIAGPGQSSNALAATPYTWPDPPELLIAESGVLQVALTWNAPRHTGFNDIIGYKVFFGTSSPDEQFGEELSLLAHGVNVTGLLAGTSYRFGVKAVNEAGDSNLSNILEATAFNVPDAPTGLTAVSNNAQVVLNWTAPSFNGGSVIDHYLVYQGSVALSNHYSSWNATISDLINGQTYVFTVAAHNLAGYGDQSTFVMTVPMTVPSEPMSVAATPGIDRITISWSSPASVGGSGLLGYHVYRTGAGEQALLASFSESVHGYVDGNVTSGNTYTYTVVAFNAVGNGPASTQVSATLQADGPTDNTLLYAGMAIVIIAALAIAVAVMRRKK